MGECGCGEISPYKIVKVGDNVLVIEVYSGCPYCGTGLGVSLHLFTPEGAEEFGFEPTETFEPNEYGIDEAEIAFPLVDPHSLINAARELDPDETIGSEDGYGSLTDWLEDEGLNFLQKAIEDTMERAKEHADADAR